MKKPLVIAAILCMGTALGWAAFPVIDGFYDFNSSQWIQFWTVDATTNLVDAGTDGIPDSPNATGKLIQMSVTNAAATSFGILTGELTDTNYNLKVQAYVPVTNAVDPALEAFIYHMLIFYRDANGYGRLHTHFNENTGAVANPRIRLQITNPAFVYTSLWESPANFQHSQGWHELKVELTGTTANSYYDGVLLGASDWTAEAATRTAGQFGIGGFLNASGTLTNYFSGFKAWQGTEPADPTPPEPTPIPTAAETWTYYE